MWPPDGESAFLPCSRWSAGSRLPSPRGAIAYDDVRYGICSLLSSCPALGRASTSYFVPALKMWMAGTGLRLRLRPGTTAKRAEAFLRRRASPAMTCGPSSHLCAPRRKGNRSVRIVAAGGLMLRAVDVGRAWWNADPWFGALTRSGPQPSWTGEIKGSPRSRERRRQ